jgi:hypothetical protein
MLNVVAAGAMLVSGLVAPASMVAATPVVSPNNIVVDVVSANGSGCPAGSAEVAVSPDGKAFTVTYSQYTAQSGAGAQPTDFRKNCQLGVNVHGPQGLTYAIVGADYRGYANLQPGARAQESANYYFQGEPRTTRISHTFTGPTDRDWQTTDHVGVAALSWLPCGEERNLNINTELRVAGSRSDHSNKTTSFLTMDSTDASISTVYHLAWKSCH